MNCNAPRALWRAAVGAALVASGASAGSFCASPGFAPEWSEEFSGSTLDATSWTVSADTPRDDSSCREATCTAKNVAVEGGELVLTARRENVGWANYTTGAINSHGKRGWGARAGAPVRICIAGSVPVGPNETAHSYCMYPAAAAALVPAPAPAQTNPPSAPNRPPTNPCS